MYMYVYVCLYISDVVCIARSFVSRPSTKRDNSVTEAITAVDRLCDLRIYIARRTLR